MKKFSIVFIILCFIGIGCANPGRYNTQKGTAIGTGLGAITGQIIGGDTTSTLIGAGIGGIAGSLIGNSEDQRADILREKEQKTQPQNKTIYTSPKAQLITQPPGTWVQVPGYWNGSTWIPAHQEWKPIQP